MSPDRQHTAPFGSPLTLPFAGRRWVLEPAAMAAVDQAAIRSGLPGMALMESAGRSVAGAILEAEGSGRAAGGWGRPAIVWVGGGNNGGDGLVAARTLAAAGWRVELELFVDPGRLTGDAALQWALVDPIGLPVRRIAGGVEAEQAVERARGASWVVDALLGTGTRGDVREPIRGAITALNERRAGAGATASPGVVAVDAPSGLDGRTGRVRGAAVRASATVTFGFPKPGLFLADGPAHVGRLTILPLGYPPAALEAAPEPRLCWSSIVEAAAALPSRRHDLHKGGAGRLLLLAGSTEYRGAAILAATAALRSGAGLCTVATPEPVAGFLVGRLPEAIALPLPVTRSGALSARAADVVARAAERADAVAIGPGLTTARGVAAVVRAALAASLPAVLDADGLNVLAADPAPVERVPPTILTPHPGELGRWLGRQAAEVDAERVEAAREAAARWRVHVVLKGSPSVVAEPGGKATLNLTGNPGLAVGGSGDVLTGLLGALLAQGVEASLAGIAAPFLHGLAADWAARDLGPRALVPSDLFRYLPLAIREVSGGRGAALLERLDHRYGSLLAAEGPA